MSQKHLLLYVPDYDRSNGSAGTHGPPLSYLKLGSAATDSSVLTCSRERGDDLLEVVGLKEKVDDFFIDDHRDSQTKADTKYFRYDGPGKDHKTTSDRPTLTKQLMGADGVTARGGWRDHTDGNRIVTVRGDRVDVVVGNYRRVVLGRVIKPASGEEEGFEPSLWEVSGGHIWDATNTGVAELKSIEWVKEEGEHRWKVTEETEKGDCITRYSGRFEEHFNGPSKKETIGKRFGSAKERPVITEEHYIGTSKGEIHADSVHSKTVVGTMTATETAGAISETSCAIAGADTVLATGTFNDQLITSSEFNFELFGARVEFEAGAAKSTSSGCVLNLNTGVVFELAVGGVDSSVYAGARADVRLGPSLEVKIGAWMELNLNVIIDVPLQKTEAAPIPAKLAATKFHVKATKTDLGAATSRLFGFHNST